GHRQRRDACRGFSEEARRALPIQGPHLWKYRVHVLHTGSVEKRCGLRQHARRWIPDDGWPQLVCRREVSEQPDRRYSPRANGEGRPIPIIGRLKLAITDYGRTHPLMKLSPDASANTKQWSDLPPLTD